MGWTTQYPSSVNFVADPNSVDRLPTGRQIDWSQVDAGLANADGNKVIPAGTAVVEDGTSKKLFRRLDAARVAETTIGVLATDAVENDKSAALSGYGVIVGGVMWETLMPDSDDAAWGTIKTELGTNGTAWHFNAYADDSAV